MANVARDILSFDVVNPRATVCFGKVDGKWMITHEHNSVPFNMENGQASLDLKP